MFSFNLLGPCIKMFSFPILKSSLRFSDVEVIAIPEFTLPTYIYIFLLFYFTTHLIMTEARSKRRILPLVFIANPGTCLLKAGSHIIAAIVSIAAVNSKSGLTIGTII